MKEKITQEEPREAEDLMIFQISRFISIYDIYTNLCLSGSDAKYRISYDFSKENMLVQLLSNLYLIFDNQKSAQSLTTTIFKNQEIEQFKNEIIKDWKEIEPKIKPIRHNIGFHSSKTMEGQKYGTSQFKELDKKPFDLILKLIELQQKYLLKKIKR